MESIKFCSTCWKISICIMIISAFMIKLGTAVVPERLYSLGNLTNHSHACTGNDEIILVCHGRGSNITWTATSDSIDIGRIIFFSSESEGTIVNQGTIKGILVEVDRRSGGTNLMSELYVYTTPSMRPINITCSSEGGSGSHLIVPPATPDRPILLAPRQLQEMDSSSTSVLYYLQWEAPSNINDTDLDHYQLYANDTLVQRIHADQRYALISLQEGTTTAVKVAAANKCGQVSNYSLVSISPNIVANEPHRPQTTVATDGYATDDYVTTADVQSEANLYAYGTGISGSQRSMASLVIFIYSTFLALVLFTLASI